VFAVALRQYYLIRGSAARVVPLFLWVAIDIVLWGFITKYLGGALGGPGRIVTALLGAVLLWDFLTRVMQGVTMAFFEDVWSRNFLNVFATPLRMSEYLGGFVLSSVVTSAIGLLVMLLVAYGVFGFSLLSIGVALAPFLLVLFLFGIALGIVAAALVLGVGPAAEWFVWPIPAMVAPFACVFYPVITLPVWMQVVARMLPASWVFEGMRAVMRGGPADPVGLAIGAALAVGYLGLATATFAAVHRHVVRTGLLARYSAESVT
jgi:ABC-2 type transport system permease protein